MARRGYNLELKAPAGKFRVVGVDLFSHEDYLMEQMRIKDRPQGNCLGRGQHAVGDRRFERVADQTEGDEFSLHKSLTGGMKHGLHKQ
jgi:hypothetical protein